MVKGIGLLSGGLDSMLAFKVLQEQGIHTIGVSFVTPFFGSQKAEKSAEILEIELRIINISEIHLKMVLSPKYGYGKGMNPCIDCHALMFHEAGKIMESEGADFLFSGEVLDERPMSQNYQSLMKVSKESGYKDFIIRPLSAKLLPETIPEKEGKVIREKLLDIRGRSRKRQIELAEYYGIKEYPQPAGGCLLTEPGYSQKLKELIKNSSEIDLRNVEFLEIGRHFRLNTGDKLIVGRDEKENNIILSRKKDSDAIFDARDHPGPIAIITNLKSQDSISTSAAICAYYSDAPKDQEILIDYFWRSEKNSISIKALPKEEIDKFRIGS